MLTAEQRDLLRRYVSIDGAGNVVGNDNTVHITKQAAADYAVQIGEQQVTFNIAELRQVLNIENSQVGVIADNAHIEGGIHFGPSGDTFDMSGDFRGAQVNIKSTIPSHFPPKPEGRCDYYRRILLPAHYVSRPEVLDATRAALLESARGMALTSAIQQAPEALHGMGGIGKTVVARALCEDPDVQEAFPDGILWTTLGREVTEPDLRRKLRAWIEDALGGIVSETAPTVDRLKAILAQLLEDRACLLIVDNVWRRTHAEAFQVGGPRCCLLITTRDAEVARGLGARLHPVGVMARERAVALLEQWADGKLDDVDEDVKAQIVKRVGYLPLAVKLAGEQLRRHDPVRWLERFDARKLQSPRPETVHDSLFQTFSLSLDDLREEERRCYTALTIFPEDEPIPFVALAKLWGALVGLDEGGTRDLMHDLAARALVQLDETHLGLAVTLHNLLRDFIAAELGEQGAQGTHHALLDAYRATKEGQGWHTATDDGYLYDHLAYHLDALADHDDEAANELRALFADDAWLHARVPADDYRYDGYLTDLTRAWQRAQAIAKQQVTEEQQPLAVVDCLHCAVIHTSINSLMINYVPELVAKLLKTGQWSPENVVDLAQRISDPAKKALMLHMLLTTGKLTASQLTHVQNQVLTAIRAIRNEVVRFQVLSNLAPDLQQKFMEEALMMARGISYNHHRAEALVSLIPALQDDSLLCEVLKIAQSMYYAGYKTKVLAALSLKLPNHLLDDALEIAQGIVDFEHRAEALVALAPRLSEETLSKTLAEVQRIRAEWRRAEALASLIPYLPEKLLHEVRIMPNIKRKYNRALILSALAMRLPRGQCEHAIRDILTIIHSTEDKDEQSEILGALVLQLIAGMQRFTRIKTDRILVDILETLMSVSEKGQAEILEIIAPHLSERLSRNALRVVRSMEAEYWQAKAFIGLARYLPIFLFEDAWSMAQGIGYETDRVEVFTELALSIEGDHSRRSAWLSEALRMAQSFNVVPCQIKLLSELDEEALIVELPSKTARLGRLIDDYEFQVLALATLSHQLLKSRKTKILRRILNLAEKTDERSRLLADLLPVFPHGQQRRIFLEIVDLINSDSIMVHSSIIKIRAKLFPFLPKKQQYELLEYALHNMHQVHVTEHIEVLEELASHLCGELQEKVLARAWEITHKMGFQDRAWALIKLAPLLSEDLAEKVSREFKRLEVVEGVNRDICIQVLIALAPRLSTSSQQEAICKVQTEVKTIESNQRQSDILMELAPQLKGEAQQKALKDGLVAARLISDKADRTDMVIALMLRSVQLSKNRTTLHEAQRKLSQIIWDYQNCERKDLLGLLARDDAAFLRAFDLPQNAYARIAQSIIDICTKWEWL